MAGTIREKSKGVWELRAFAGADPVSGRPHQVSRTYRGGRRDAEKKLAELVTEVSSGRHGSTKATFGELLDRWIEQQERLDRSPVTMRNLRSETESILRPALGRISLRRLGASEIDAFYAAQSRAGKAPATVRKYHAHISAALAQAVRWGWIDSNPAKLATLPPKGYQRVEPPDLEKLRELLAEAAIRNPVLAVALSLAALTGARRAELCALCWGDIDTDAARLTIRRAVVRGEGIGQLVTKTTKTGRVRRLSLDPVSVAILERHRATCDEAARAAGATLGASSFIFSPEPDGSVPFNPEILTAFVRRLRDKVDLPNLHLHHLRHFAATQLIGAGIDVRTVAGRLGHSSPSITLNVYAHFIEDADREAARRVGDLMHDVVLPPRTQPDQGALHE
ncbi:MAG: site-specific integrase [Actinobacteria bacterium]|jgi:integrase|nr:site-specific integrase [Actinomycetota bacterium]MDA8183342.1 site-specific integrase [Actinomycetota bacterium]